MLRRIVVLIALCVLVVTVNADNSDFEIDLETGMVLSGYNDIRVPNDGGSDFSLSDNLDTDMGISYRFKFTYIYKKWHSFSALFAPLKLKSNGQFDSEVDFDDETFAANQDIDAEYKLNSYRLTYRFNFPEFWDFKVGLGLTAKLRDLKITLEDASQKSEESNFGFVPLINFYIERKLTDKTAIVIDGDALTSSLGRAEDIMLAFKYRPFFFGNLRLGYRLFDSGLDIDDLYNSSMQHHFLIGATVYF